MNVNILKYDEFNPSTITMVSNFNKSINSNDIAEYLPVVHLFDKKTNERLKLISGSRNSIKYYGHEGIIISVCYKKTRRGMRTGAMNNMVSIDLQYKEKNIHIKLSSTTMTSVGTSGFEFGNEVFKLMTHHINMLNTNVKYIRTREKDYLDKNINWIFENCTDSSNNLIPMNLITEKMEKTEGLDEKIIKSCIVYIDDFERNQASKFKEKIINFCNKCHYFEENLKFVKPNIFNSVYHINIFKDTNKRIPLHKLAPYLAEKNFIAEFHNWTSEGVNICFEIEEEKNGIHHINKDYKHRFTIHERGTIRQCSPTFKDESYRYYLGLIKQIERFFVENNIEKLDNFKTHIVETKILF